MRVFITLMLYTCFTFFYAPVICRPAKNEEFDSYARENEYEDAYVDSADGPTTEVSDDFPGQDNNVQQHSGTKPAIDREMSKDSFARKSLTENYNTEQNNRNDNEQSLSNNKEFNKKLEADDALQPDNIKRIQADTTDENHETAKKRSKKEIRNKNSGIGKAIIETGIKTDEEIIRSQIKKLTKDELDELINSLSTDKRELLLKIIDEDEDDNVRKRETAQKFGTAHILKPKRNQLQVDDAKELPTDMVGENLFVSSNKDSTIKSQISSIVDPTENDPEFIKTDNNETRDSNKDELKRDTFKENVASQDNPSSDDEEYYDQENPCAFLDQMKNENKTDTSQEASHLEDSLKLLEDSFANAYDEVDAEITPHIRVKRRNNDFTVKKRAAYLIDPVQSCVPHEHSHDEEGNEYDDIVPYDSSAYINENIGNEKDDDSKANNAKALVPKKNEKLKTKPFIEPSPNS